MIISYKHYFFYCISRKKVKDNGGRVVGIYCSFVPVELIYAAKAVPVSLCATNEKPISAAERDLPRNLCPLIKASYGYALTDTCPFFYFSDFIRAETCYKKSIALVR